MYVVPRTHWGYPMSQAQQIDTLAAESFQRIAGGQRHHLMLRAADSPPYSATVRNRRKSLCPKPGTAVPAIGSGPLAYATPLHRDPTHKFRSGLCHPSQPRSIGITVPQNSGLGLGCRNPVHSHAQPKLDKPEFRIYGRRIKSENDLCPPTLFSPIPAHASWALHVSLLMPKPCARATKWSILLCPCAQY